MAQIEIGGVTYTAIDDKNASAIIENGIGVLTIQDKVKIEGNEYIVTRIDKAEGQSYLYRIGDSRKKYTGYRNFICDIPDTVTSIDDLTGCSTTIPTSVLIISRIYTSDPVTIKIKSMNPPMLGGASANITLIVPKGALEVYKNHPQWGKLNHISEDPSLNEDSVPSSSNKVSSNSKEISELKKELNELRKDFNEFRKDIANLMKLHKELREDFEELKKKD